MLISISFLFRKKEDTKNEDKELIAKLENENKGLKDKLVNEVSITPFTTISLTEEEIKQKPAKTHKTSSQNPLKIHPKPNKIQEISKIFPSRVPRNFPRKNPLI